MCSHHLLCCACCVVCCACVQALSPCWWFLVPSLAFCLSQLAPAVPAVPVPAAAAALHPQLSLFWPFWRDLPALIGGSGLQGSDLQGLEGGYAWRKRWDSASMFWRPAEQRVLCCAFCQVLCCANCRVRSGCARTRIVLHAAFRCWWRVFAGDVSVQSYIHSVLVFRCTLALFQQSRVVDRYRQCHGQVLPSSVLVRCEASEDRWQLSAYQA